MKKLLIFIIVLVPEFIFAQQPVKFVSTIRPSPNINAGPDLVLPNGQPVQAQATTDDPSNLIDWDGPNGFNSNVLRPWLNDLGTYTIQATNSFGCIALDQMQVLQASPLDTFWLTIPTSCPNGDQILLDNYVSHPGSGTFSGPGVINRILYPGNAGSYNVIWSIGDKNLTANYVVYAAPNIYFPEDTLFRCTGTLVWLGAAGMADIWSWTNIANPNVILSNDQYYQVLVGNTTTYQLNAGLVYYDKVCYTTDNVTVDPIVAGFTYAQQRGTGQYGEIYGSDVYFIPNFKNAYSYSWNFGNNYIPGGGTSIEVSPTYNYAPYLGYFTATLTQNSFCGISTTTQTVYVNYLVTSTSVEDLEKKELVLYPNPAVDYINLDFGENKSYEIKIFDIHGKQMFYDKMSNQQYVLDVSSYAAGNYFVKVIDEDGGFLTAKFIKK